MPFDGAGFIGSDRLSRIEAVIQLIGTPDRWCKGRRRTHDGRFCIYGVLVEANALNLSSAILHAAHEVTGERYCCVEAFNDNINTTHPLVVRVLARARDDLIGQPATIMPRPLNWRVRLQELVQSFAAKSPT